MSLVYWLDEQGVLVLVPTEYLKSQVLSTYKKLEKLSAWAEDPDQLANEVDLVVCLGLSAWQPIVRIFC